MKRASQYNTKQHKAILDYIISVKDSHITAAQIVKHFQKEEIAIGRTTIYRQLDKLIESGQVRKYTIDGMSGAYYEFVPQNKSATHLHLKCESCGAFFHLSCSLFDDVQHHLFDEHAFMLNINKSVLYGQCEHCMQNA